MSLVNVLLKLTSFKCPKCTHQFTQEDVHKAESQIKSGVLVCPSCQHLLGHSTPTQSNQLFDKTIYKPSADLKFTQNQNGTLSFSLPWKTKMTSIILLFGFVWLSMCGIAIYMSIKSGGATINGVYTTDLGKIKNMMGLFCIPGFLTLSFGLVQFLNKRQITVSRSLISFFDEPLWSLKLTRIDPKNIMNLAVVRHTTGTVNGQRQFAHAVNVHFKDGQAIKLCNANSLADALFVEQTIEKFLGITDNQSLDELNAV
jgi:transcription elongation factor Elf1